MLEIDRIQEQGGRKRPSSRNYSVFWKTILNKWFELRSNVFPLLTHFHSVNRRVFILMTSFQFLLLVRSEAKTICYKSKLFSLYVWNLSKKFSSRGGWRFTRVTLLEDLHYMSLNWTNSLEYGSWLQRLTPSCLWFCPHLTFSK